MSCVRLANQLIRLKFCMMHVGGYEKKTHKKWLKSKEKVNDAKKRKNKIEQKKKTEKNLKNQNIECLVNMLRSPRHEAHRQEAIEMLAPQNHSRHEHIHSTPLSRYSITNNRSIQYISKNNTFFFILYSRTRYACVYRLRCYNFYLTFYIFFSFLSDRLIFCHVYSIDGSLTCAIIFHTFVILIEQIFTSR